MKKIVLLLIALIILPDFLPAQITREPGRHLPKPTPKGIGKIDTRIDNMRYWKKMGDSGYVYLAPVESVPPAIFKGSVIESPMVMTTDSPDVPTTTVNSTQSENSVFVHPTNNQILLNSNNSTQNPVGSLYGANYLLSDDGGTTWGGSVNGAGGSNSGDPTTAISLTGRQFINFINSPGGQGIAYSDNNGATWSTATIAPNPGSLADKNHMWIDNMETSPYEGYLYAAWTDFGGVDDTEIKISRSTNDGINWSTPINISSAINAGSHNQGVNVQTGPNGEVYVAWTVYDGWPTDETAIGFAKSEDGGATFAPASRKIINIRGIRTSETSKDHRVNSFPSMAVDISGGVNNGNIYIVWANIGVPGVNTGSDIDVYMSRSSNEGDTWSTPVKVNQDPSGLGKEHYFPWITCDRLTGELSVVFYDDRNVSSTQCEVFAASSSDAGNTWEDFKVSDIAFTPAPIFGLADGYMGDYLGIAAVGGMVYPVWPDNRTGVVISYTSPFRLSNSPFANFLSNTTNPCLNEIVIFDDLSMNTPVSWLWTITPSTFSFENETNANSQNPQISFNSLGNYTVQLMITNAEGSDTEVKTNYIAVNNANADFNANVTEIQIDNYLIFTDESTCNITSYNWNFGADATPAAASTQGPHTVSYSSTGYKTISLTLNGTVTETKTDYIEVLPETYNMSNTTLTTCSGVFYDPQGTSNYLDNLSYTMTFMPADTSKNVRAVFSLFDLEVSSGCIYDWLKVYDGASTSATLLGTWCGTTSPGTVVASNASGALTFQFYSDGSVVGQGWVATLGCVNSPPPSYCVANAGTCDEFIERVQFNTIDNSTGCTSGGYADYTALYTRVSPGFTYPISITNGNLGWPTDQCGIWVDWNHDYDFLDAGETITVSGTPGIGPYTAIIIPPVNAVKGMTRMRARITYGTVPNSCGTSSFGEVEDYGIYVGTAGLWEGGTAGAETDWNTPNNWNDGRVPTSATDVIIPSGSDYYPEVSGNLNCQDMEISDGATITVQPGSVMNVNGDLSVGEGNSGNLIINGGTCNVLGIISALPGSSVSLINGGVMNDNN